MKVLVLKKNEKEVGRITPDRRSLVIGRSPVCDLVVRKDKNIKPLHFLIEWTGEGNFDPYSGFWTIIDISEANSVKVNKNYSGEAHVLIDNQIEVGGYQFSFVEEKLAQSAVARGVISRSLDYENDDKVYVKSNTDSVLELVTYSLSNDVVTSINHFTKDLLTKGIKINSLSNLNITYAPQKPNVLSIENLGERNLIDIYNRSERLLDFFSKENSICYVDIDDYYLLYSQESAYYIRWVPKVSVKPPPRAWSKDPVILTLIFATISMFIIGIAMRSIERPETLEIPKPPRVATVEVLEVKPVVKETPPPPPPIIQKEVKKEEVVPEPPKEEPKKVAAKPIEDKKPKPVVENKPKARNTKEQGARATVKTVEENNKLSQGLNQKAPVKNVNTVGLLGKLGGAKKIGTGVSAQALISNVTPTDSAVGDEGRVLINQPPTGKVNLTSGKTEANDDDGKGLSAASTTLKMDNVSRGAKISGMVSSKATGSIGTGAYGGNSKGGSDSIQTLGGSVSMEVKSMEVLGGLTKEQVRQAISDNKRALRNCHEQYLIYKKDLGGRLVLKWKINGEGPVDTVNVQSSTTNHGTFDTCVVDVIKKIIFPTAQNGNSTIVIYPFVFQPKK